MSGMLVSMAAPSGSIPLLVQAGRSVLFWAVVCTVFGFWLVLPGGGRRRRTLGGLLALIGLACYGAELQRLTGLFGDSLFLTLALVTVVACAATVTVRNPVYSAVWFALALLGVGALMLLQGAQFLGVATVVVYAGAIVVTLLFVLMLAQPTGLAPCDRQSWDAPLSAATGALMIGMLTLTVMHTLGPTTAVGHGQAAQQAGAHAAAKVLGPHQTARLGGLLFSQHLLAVEVAGVLLLVALVGAVAMVEHGRQQNGTADELPEMK